MMAVPAGAQAAASLQWTGSSSSRRSDPRALGSRYESDGAVFHRKICHEIVYHDKRRGQVVDIDLTKRIGDHVVYIRVQMLNFRAGMRVVSAGARARVVWAVPDGVEHG